MRVFNREESVKRGRPWSGSGLLRGYLTLLEMLSRFPNEMCKNS
jgi:hypothetical protein